MNRSVVRGVVLAVVVSAGVAVAAVAAVLVAAEPLEAALAWRMVVNNGVAVPGTSKLYNSYNQPAVNASGLVVFRARSRGPQRESGIYARQMPDGVLRTIADLKTVVPAPNNTLYPAPGGGAWGLGTFLEFPSIPRVALHSNMVATRGNHRPVWTPPGAEDERVGTTGIYVDLDGDEPTTLPLTGAGKLGALAPFWFLAVPGAAPGTFFDVFPGSPAITDDGTIAFKGNYTEAGVAKTGVFFRVPETSAGYGEAPVRLLANTSTPIPGLPRGVAKRFGCFGSTSPLSAAGDAAVFVGLDDEAAPRAGGIYLAELDPTAAPGSVAPLTLLVGLGTRVPGLAGPAFRRLGEGLSFDGRYLAFWGAWGAATRTVRLTCPSEGNRERLAYCRSEASGSTFDPGTGTWFQDVEVPLNQGVFVLDTRTGRIRQAAGAPRTFDTFVFWNFSGRAPGSQEEDGEPARWRSAAFVAVSGGTVVFKAAAGPRTGIYLQRRGNEAPLTLVDTSMPGTALDAQAVGADGLPLPITELGLEADGLRGNQLVINARMGVEEGEEGDSWAGIYLAELTRP